LPSAKVAKPHCGLSARCSMGKCCAASSIRRSKLPTWSALYAFPMRASLLQTRAVRRCEDFTPVAHRHLRPLRPQYRLDPHGQDRQRSYHTPSGDACPAPVEQHYAASVRGLVPSQGEVCCRRGVRGPEGALPRCRRNNAVGILS
jgi:hypothetical protein